jgi:hypothetical protein
MENMAQASHPEIAKLPPDHQRAILREMLLRRWQRGGFNGPGGPIPIGEFPPDAVPPAGRRPNGPMPITDSEMERLHSGLSPELRAKLEARTPQEQSRIVREWLRETATHELDEQLGDYFENVISDEDRDRLMSLPGDDMYDKLSTRYSDYVEKKSPDMARRGDQQRRNGQWQRSHRPGAPGNGSPRTSRDGGDAAVGREPKGSNETVPSDSSNKKLPEQRDPAKAAPPAPPPAK